MTQEDCKKLEKELTLAFTALREAEELTEGKVDISFLLNVVGSYILSKEQDKLGEDYYEPWELFEENIKPLVESSEVVVECIEEEEDGSTSADTVA